MTDVNTALQKLTAYVSGENFQGYDIYDGLNITNSPFLLNNYFTNTLITQGFKKLPFNLRPFLGMKPVKMPKAIGIFLNSYCNLARLSNDDAEKKRLLTQAENFMQWLDENRSRKYSGLSWPFGFKYKFMFDEPTVVITSIIAKGLFNYHELTGDPRAKEMIMETASFILDNIPVTETADGICFSYTVPVKDCCYNASMLAAEALAQAYYFTRDQSLLEKIIKAVDFTIAHQHPDGRWNYSINPKTGIERKQVDFHQGYVLESLYRIIILTGIKNPVFQSALQKGLDFYFTQQFFPDGRAKWRIPVDSPVEIHNQAQGIIIFAMMAPENEKYLLFAGKILDWTIKNMQDRKGWFYYQKHRFYTNKIPYMRWSQAWMMYAMTVYKLQAQQ